MRIEAIRPNLDYLYEQEIQKFLLRPSYQMTPEILGKYLQNYLQAAEMTSKLLTKAKRTLSDEDFLYHLTRTGNVIFNPRNVIYTLNKTYQKNYQTFTTILTTMVEKYFEDGILREYIIGYNVLVNEGIFIDDRLYTKAEIVKLVNNHDILIYNVFEARYEGAKFAMEDYQTLESVDLQNFLNNNSEIKKNVLKYTRRNITSKQIEQVIYDYLWSLQSLVKEITTAKDKFVFEQNFSKQCRKEFQKNGQVRRLERMLLQVTK